jgi:hypothetical protein
MSILNDFLFIGKNESNRKLPLTIIDSLYINFYFWKWDKLGFIMQFKGLNLKGISDCLENY